MKKIENRWVITFSGGLVKVSGKELDDIFLVKWFCDDEFRGEYELGSGNWGAYPLSLGNWKFEFWNKINVEYYEHNLENEDILIIADLPPVLPGKTLPINKLIDRGNEIKEEYKCNVVFYFKGSENYNLPFKTLKMNDEYNFKLILEEKYG
jgi:hypothetical protein